MISYKPREITLPSATNEHTPAEAQSLNLPGGANQWLRWGLGVTLPLILLLLIAHQYSWSDLVQAWTQISLPQLLLAFSLFFISHLLRALRIFDFLGMAHIRQFPLTFKLSAWHLFYNNLLPMRMGEAAFPLLLKRYFGQSYSDGIHRLIWLRLLDLGVMGTAVAVIGLTTMPHLLPATMTQLAQHSWILVPFSVFVVALVWLYRAKLPVTWIRKQATLFRKNAPNNRFQHARLWLWTLAAWVCKLVAISVAVSSMAEISLIAAISGALGADATSILPIHGIAGGGTFEAGFYSGAALVGERPDSLLLTAFNVHLFVFFSTLIIACLLLPIRRNTVIRRDV